jgi:hypothetical protein
MNIAQFREIQRIEQRPADNQNAVREQQQG